MICGNSFLQALSAAGLTLVSTETNLVDQVWEDHGRPDPPNEGLIVMDMSYTGQCVSNVISCLTYVTIFWCDCSLARPSWAKRIS